MYSQVKKFYLWILPWYPILNMYFVGKFSLALIIFLPACLYILITQPRKIALDKSLLILFFLLIFVEFLQLALPYIDRSVTINNIAMQTIYLIEIAAVTCYVKLNDIIKPYIVACLIMMFGIFYQTIQIHIFNNYTIENPILIFPNLISENNVAFGSIRPMSFFQEPQAYATYMAVFVVTMLSYNKRILAIVATLSILLSGSTEGLALVGLIWGLFIIQGKSQLYVKIIFAVIGTLLIHLYTTSPFFDVGYQKVMNTEYDANVRLIQGAYVLKRMSISDLILGMGSSNNQFYRSIASSLGKETNAVVYFSSATGTFIMFGLFVGICYWWFLLKKLSLKNSFILIYSIILCVIPFAQTCFWSSTFVYLFSIYYMLCKEFGINKSRLIFNNN